MFELVIQHALIKPFPLVRCCVSCLMRLQVSTGIWVGGLGYEAAVPCCSIGGLVLAVSAIYA